jgi:hypothetical protein
VFNNRLYIVYKGARSSSLYTAYFDGEKWNGNTKISDQPGGISPGAGEGPSVVVFNNRLYVVYVGAHTSNLYTASFDGEKWYGNQKIDEQPGHIKAKSLYSPGVAVFNNRLYLVYASSNLSKDVYTASFDGEKWYGNGKIREQPGAISPQSHYSPGVAVFNGRLYIAYGGRDSGALYSAFYTGEKWTGNQKVSDETGTIAPKLGGTPALAVYDRKLRIVHKGAFSNSLYVETFDGETWSGNQKISEQPGGIQPESNFGAGMAVYSYDPLLDLPL